MEDDDSNHRQIDSNSTGSFLDLYIHYMYLYVQIYYFIYVFLNEPKISLLLIIAIMIELVMYDLIVIYIDYKLNYRVFEYCDDL